MLNGTGFLGQYATVAGLLLWAQQVRDISRLLHSHGPAFSSRGQMQAVWLSRATLLGLLLWAQQARNINRLLHSHRPAFSSGGQMLVVS